mmetsp:Transcript_814/g.2774  ORF Transcript_814/g.2774 Transcript_814/m.2774 type:complete len:230 (-) Transcript_814:584-1273(-)
MHLSEILLGNAHILLGINLLLDTLQESDKILGCTEGGLQFNHGILHLFQISKLIGKIFRTPNVAVESCTSCSHTNQIIIEHFILKIATSRTFDAWRIIRYHFVRRTIVHCAISPNVLLFSWFSLFASGGGSFGLSTSRFLSLILESFGKLLLLHRRQVEHELCPEIVVLSEQVTSTIIHSIQVEHSLLVQVQSLQKLVIYFRVSGESLFDILKKGHCLRKVCSLGWIWR